MEISPRPNAGAALVLFFLIATGSHAVLAAGVDAPGGATRPNIVVILADDLGWRDVGWHGGPIRTPHLDQLARDGVRLEQHYVAPVCSPTRSALLSGRYWSRFGVTNPQNERAYPFDTVTLASALKSVGYDTAICGKWHLGSTLASGPRRFGFDHGYGSLAGGVEPWEHFYKSGPFERTWHRQGELIEEQGHVTDLIAAEAVRWLEGRGDRPFLLYVPFTAPHIPIREPDAWVDQYSEIAEPSRRHYAACVSHLDDAIGRLVAALERLRKRQNTLIVFSSDNGGLPTARNDDRQYPHGAAYPQGPAGGTNEPLRGGKGELYEGGIRVAALANWPGRLAARELQSPLHVVDWMPTLCGLAGYEPPRDLRWDGLDVWPVLAGEREPAPRTLYWAGTGFRTAAVRRGDWKLIVPRGAERQNTQARPSSAQLFNLKNDPYETQDLAETQIERRAELESLLAQVAAADRDQVANDE